MICCNIENKKGGCTLTTYPEGPYRIRSGKNAGNTLEQLMFQKPHLVFYWEKLQRGSRGNKNKLHPHLEWLLRQGENRRAKILCPQCRKRPVAYFSVVYSGRDDFSLGTPFTCCGNDECYNKLESLALAPLEVLPLRFSVMKKRSRLFQRKVVELFRRVFRLPKPLGVEESFMFFKN